MRVSVALLLEIGKIRVADEQEGLLWLDVGDNREIES